MTGDYRDLVIEDLADENCLLQERINSLEADVAIYRELAAAAFDAVCALTISNRSLQQSTDRLKDELQGAREERLLHAGADDEAA